MHFCIVNAAVKPRIKNQSKSNQMKTFNSNTNKTTYCTKFKNDGEATIGGVFFFVVPVLFTVFCALTNVKWEGIEVFTTVMISGSLILRAAATLWIANIAKELNRNHIQWMAIAFFVPGIALTIIGQKKKIKDPNAYKQFLYTHKMAEIYTAVPNVFQGVPSLQMAS